MNEPSRPSVALVFDTRTADGRTALLNALERLANPRTTRAPRTLAQVPTRRP